MKKTTAIIFDFDGTLVDSMKQWSGKMLHVLKSFNVTYPDDIIKTITPLGDKGTAEYFLSNFAIDSTAGALIEMMDEYAKPKYAYEILAKEAVPETLRKLKSLGYSLNVLTASPHKMLDPCLKRLELFDLFDNVWSCDDFNTTKSDPDIYIKAAEKIGASPENCVFLDDNINSLATAKKANLTVIGVYDESSEDYTQQIKELCDAYIYSFNELCDTLRKEL